MASPGPDLFPVLRLATKSRKHTITIAAGIGTGVVIWITLTVFGFAVTITINPLLMGVVQLTGGCCLIYMSINMTKVGINILRELRVGAAPALGSEALRSSKAAFRQGSFTNILNPKTILFLTTVFPQFIPVGTSMETLVLCTLVLIISRIAFFLFVAIIVSTDAVVKRMVLAGPQTDTVTDAISLALDTLLVTSGAKAVLQPVYTCLSA